MTQAALNFDASPTSLNGRLAEFFRERPSVWVDGAVLAAVAGKYAWRSRVSEIRRAPYLMRIANRQRRVKVGEHEITISEYRYEP